MLDIKLKELFEAGAHYGHRVRFWHPSNERFVYGRHGGINIINLDRTIEAFHQAQRYITEQVSQGKVILFVCTKRIAQPHLANAAKSCQMPFVDNRWLGGTLTNFYTVRQSIDRLDYVENMLEDDRLSTVYVKKEILKMRKNYQKLLRSFGGIREMSRLPDILFVVDVGYEKIAVSEAKKLGIPVVGVVDTNHSSYDIDFPIPANDDSMSAIRIYLDLVADAVNQGLADQTPDPGASPALRPAPERESKPAIKAADVATAAPADAPPAEALTSPDSKTDDVATEATPEQSASPDEAAADISSADANDAAPEDKAPTSS